MTTYLQDAEIAIAKATIKALLDAGFAVTMNDGEENIVIASRNVDAIFAAMMTTDEDYLIAETPDDADHNVCGWVRFIYGNDGWDVINDYSARLESVLVPVNALADELEAKFG